MMMLRTSLSSSSSTLPSPSRPPRRRRKSKSRGVHVNSSASRENRYETSFSSSSASGARGVAANSFPRDDDDDVEEVVHTVAPGDSLYGVAIAYDVDPRDLIVSNRSSSFCSRSRSSKRKSCISFVFEFLIQKYATSSIEKNKM
jgi:LysM repeat protein